MSIWVDIGHGVKIQFRTIHGETDHAGIEYSHPNGRGGECRGYVPFEGPHTLPGHGWTVVSKSPLTLTPSLLCRACGHHGHIIAGKWEPA